MLNRKHPYYIRERVAQQFERDQANDQGLERLWLNQNLAIVM